MPTTGAATADVDVGVQRSRSTAHARKDVLHLNAGRTTQHFQTATRGIEGNLHIGIKRAQGSDYRGRIVVACSEFELHLGVLG